MIFRHRKDDDETVAERHREEQAAIERHQRRQDVNLDVSLAELPKLVGTISSLLTIGVTVDEMAEKAATLLAQSDPDAIETLAKVLKEL